MQPRLFALLLICAVPMASAQSIYSWKDASGRVFYSDMPPPDAKVRTLRQGPLAPKPARSTDGTDTPSATPAAPSLAEQELAFRKRRAEAAEAEDKARKDKANDEMRQRECADNRNQLLALESGQRMNRINENGERVFLDDNERSAAIDNLRRAIERNCK